MSRQLSPQLLAEMFGQVSNDPFLILLTISNPSFSTIKLVNNTVDIVSRGETYTAYPFRLTLPPEDGETQKDITLELVNISLELIDEIRAATTPITVDMEMILASNPDEVQLSVLTLKTKVVKYNQDAILATLYLDDFLSTELTSEKYGPDNFPGLF